MHYFRILTAFVTIIIVCSTGCQLKKEDRVHEDQQAFSERDEMQKAMQHEFMMTVDPALGYIPKERLTAAIAYERRLRSLMRMDAITWAERGPNNVAGRTRALVIDSRDNTGNTVFVSSVSGGIWKTTNFKTTTPTWAPVAENMGSIAVCALAQDPSDPTVMYAGTGEGWFNNDAVRGNGIWKSTNGGTTWTQIALTDSVQTDHNFDFIQDIVVNSAGIVFATGRPSVYCNVGGVFRSADKGVNWSRPIGSWTNGQPCDSAYNFFAADLEIASNGDVYATTGFINGGEINDLGRIWRSRGGANVGNGPAAWINITPTGTWQRIELAIAPSNPAIVYALLEGTGDGIGAIKKSVDTGATWTDLPLPNWCNQGSSSADFTNGQAFYDLIVQVDPNNPNTLIIGGIDLFRSTDGGANWTQITQWARNCNAAGGGPALPVVHADQHNIMFFPGSSTELIATNDGGIYYSSNSGLAWATTTQANLNGANQTTISQKNIGYNVTQLYACDVHPTLTNYFLVGSQDNGSLELTTVGVNNGIEASVGGDGGFCHINQSNGNYQVISYVYNNFYYSRNGGGSFTRVNFNDNGMFINPSDMDDARNVLYSSAGAGQLGVISNLVSGTVSFNSFAISGLGTTRKISAVKVDPTVAGGGTVWIAGHDSTFAFRPNLIKLTNANTAPNAVVTTTLSAAPQGAYVSSIDVDPGNADHILVTLSNYGIASVYESINGGSTWTALDIQNTTATLPDVPVRWGMFVPANASVGGTQGGGILLATEVGVWFAQTSAGVATAWVPQNTGLPNVRTDMLRYRASDNLLAVATHGRGLFTTTLTSLATGIPSVPNTKNFIDYATPNSQQLFIKVGNLNMTNMEIRLFAADGKLVYSSRAKYANQNVPIAQLARGSYILKVYGNKNEQYTKQFVK